MELKMNYKVKNSVFPTWRKIKTSSPYDAIYILFNVHTLFFKSEKAYDIYINPSNQEEFFIKKIEK